MPKHELVLLKNMMQPGYRGSLADYEKTGGYQALRNTLGKIAPTDVTTAKLERLARWLDEANWARPPAPRDVDTATATATQAKTGATTTSAVSRRWAARASVSATATRWARAFFR